MSQVYGAGGKTVPKRGRLGSGAYWPEGTPLFRHEGNVFPGIQVVKSDSPQLIFGTPSRAGIATRDQRHLTAALNPNKGFYNTITLPLIPAMMVSSVHDGNNLQPKAPSTEKLRMPHEWNTNSASGTKKKPTTFRTAFGASKMPVDSPFVYNPNATYKHSVRQAPGNAVEAVKVQVANRSFARQPNPLPVSGGLGIRHPLRRVPPPSFISRGQMWMDPHNSFIAGVTSQITDRTGAGRWSVVKRGVV